jgi:tetratricopeptide (TPR) repeat protein
MAMLAPFLGPVFLKWVDFLSPWGLIEWKPLLSPKLFPALGRHSAIIGLTAWFSLSLLGTGTHLLNVAGAGRFKPRPADFNLLSIVAGFTMLGSAFTALGLAGLFYPSILFAVPSLAILTLMFPGHRTRLQPFHPGNIFRGLPPTILVVAALMLVPDTWVDTLWFHLAVPENCLRIHRSVSTGASFLFQMQFMSEHLFALALPGGNDAFAHFIGLVPFTAAVFFLLRRIGPPIPGSPAWTTSMVVFGTGTVALQAILSKNILSSSAGAIAGAVLIMKGVERGQRALLAGGFFFISCSAAIKATGYPLIAAAWIAAEIFLFNRPSWNFRSRLACLLAAALPLLPWLARSWLSWQDPVWPLLSGMLNSPFWDAESQEALRIQQGNQDLTALIPGFPLAISSYLAKNQPIVLLLGPLSLLGFTRFPLQWKWAATFAGVSILFLYCLVPAEIGRYALPAWIILASAVCTSTVSTTPVREIRGSRFFIYATAFLSSLPLAPAAFNYFSPNSSINYLLGPLDRDGYMKQMLTTYQDTTERLSTLPDLGTVICIGEGRYKGMPGRHYWPRVTGRNEAWVIARENPTPQRIAVKFRQMGCRYIVYNFISELYPQPSSAPFPWNDRMVKVWRDFVRRYTTIELPARQMDQRNGGFCVLRIHPQPRLAGPGYIPYLPGLDNIFLKANIAMFQGREDVWHSESLRLYLDFPDTGNADYLYAHSLCYEGFYRESYSIYKKMINNGAIYEVTWIDLALLSSMLGKPGEAIQYAETAIQTSPDWTFKSQLLLSYSLRKLAGSLMESPGQQNKALKLAHRAILLDPQQPANWIALASIQLKMDDRKAAQATLKSALLKVVDPANRKPLNDFMEAKGIPGK